MVVDEFISSQRLAPGLSQTGKVNGQDEPRRLSGLPGIDSAQLLFDSIQQPQIQWPEVRPLSDWRIESAKWTRGAVLQFKRYTLYREGWDHDHCECCWAKFAESGGPDVLTEGYVTEDNYRWICPTCFHELKDVMGWKLA